MAPRSFARGATWSGGSTVTTGALGLLSLVIVGRGFGSDGYAAFSVLWAVFFGVGGLFAGLQQEVTRSLSARTDSDDGRLLPLVLGLAVPVATIGGAAIARQPNLGGLTTSIPIFLGLLGLGGMTFVAGVLAARGRWAQLALLLVVDASVRTLGLGIAAVARSTALLPVAIASGAMVWMVLLWAPGYRTAASECSSASRAGFAVRCLVAMSSAGCAALVVSGLPALLVLVKGEAPGGEAGAVLAALVLVRSALLVPVYGYRPLVLRHFLDERRAAHTLLVVWGVCAAVGAVFVVVVASAGPFTLALLFGDEFRVGSRECLVLATGAIGLMFLVMSGLSLLAADRHLASTAGWVLALVVSTFALALVDPIPEAIQWAALVGPWAGVMLHLVLVSGDPLSSRQPASDAHDRVESS